MKEEEEVKDVVELMEEALLGGQSKS